MAAEHPQTVVAFFPCKTPVAKSNEQRNVALNVSLLHGCSVI